MAYTDYSFYSESFCGDVFTDQNASKWLSRASDELDALTLHRLEKHFPVSKQHVTAVKKAVCAVAEALYFVDCQRQAVSAQKAQDGRYRGAVTSVSSGRESISYQTSGSASSSVYAAAAANGSAFDRLLEGVAAKYLANIPDSTGTNLLYRGL